jgi:hypothetical protein
MLSFEQAMDEWLINQIAMEKNHRRREILERGLGHGTIEFLRRIWFPVVGNFNHLYPEWEVRDFNNGYRYLDLAYMPGGVKGGIEIQGYSSHARDIEASRFKDLCWRHSLLALDGWTFLPIAYLSIQDEPKKCQQLILSFLGKFISTDVNSQLTCTEAEAVRFARRLLRPVTPIEFSNHLRISDLHTRRILHKLVQLQIFIVASGKERSRSYILK